MSLTKNPELKTKNFIVIANYKAYQVLMFEHLMNSSLVDMVPELGSCKAMCDQAVVANHLI